MSNNTNFIISTVPINIGNKRKDFSYYKSIPFEYAELDKRERFDSTSTPKILADHIQDNVDKIIKDCPNVDWSEDFLTYNIIKTIRETLSKYMIPNLSCESNISKFDLEAYKLTGIPERNHGDIAIVVTRLFSHGPVTGVGFYEAKASSLKKMGYPSFDYQQLRRLVTSTPKLTYLLYSKMPLSSISQEWPVSHIKKDAYDKSVYATTVDANFLKQYLKNHRKHYKNIEGAMYSAGQSFGYHFVNKILSGRDLDYSRSPIKTIKRWLKTTRRSNALVVSITIQDGENQPIYTQLQLPGFDKMQLPANNELLIK